MNRVSDLMGQNPHIEEELNSCRGTFRRSCLRGGVSVLLTVSVVHLPYMRAVIHDVFFMIAQVIRVRGAPFLELQSESCEVAPC